MKIIPLSFQELNHGCTVHSQSVFWAVTSFTLQYIKPWSIKLCLFFWLHFCVSYQCFETCFTSDVYGCQVLDIWNIRLLSFGGMGIWNVASANRCGHVHRQTRAPVGLHLGQMHVLTCSTMESVTLWRTALSLTCVASLKILLCSPCFHTPRFSCDPTHGNLTDWYPVSAVANSVDCHQYSSMAAVSLQLQNP
jgi:hypothetical protein